MRARQMHDDARLLALACAWADAHPDLNQRPAVPALGPDWFATTVSCRSWGTTRLTRTC